MRAVLLALCFIPVIFAASLTKLEDLDAAAVDVDTEAEPEPEPIAEPYDTDEENDLTPEEMLVSLFGDDDRTSRDVDVVDEDEDENLNAVDDPELSEDESMAKYIQDTDPSEVKRFNDYMDAIYRRMNAALRAKLMDPMVLNLEGNKKEKVNKDEKKEKKEKLKKMTKREAVEEKEDEENEEDEVDVDRKGNPAGEKKKGGNKKKGNKKNKNKKKGNEKKGNGKGKEKEKEEKGKKGKLSDEEKAAKKVERDKAKGERQRAKAAKNEMKEGKMMKPKGKGERKTKKMNQEEHTEQRSHHHNKKAEGKKMGGPHRKSGKAENNKNGKGKKESKQGKMKNKDVEKIVGTLTGIASLRREEQVEIFSAEDHKMIQSTFTVGPLTLDVTKTSGRGQERSEKSANAKTAVLKGKMKIKVKADGSAHVKSVVFEKPDQIEVAGNLGNQKRSDNILKQSVRSMRSVAAQRVLKMARFVLKSGATIAQ
ncbi:uncharacterized protein DDB_G0286299 isoform X2 [Eurytemora carolleeae]|uniref:uncharacterized protein DDB_G0286299 isoform X2 n=1 Tax=Eurytemora carolleeae TaxID=1294199 RepID=UPI000C7788AB|nr:uncharacterized protein DDB_G0286299 isoform X2 [Eurytemora carolleeae]|eukprot:XP_023326074.1 uncharacterized protein DDB_G0286299-like isoform X2 [Eurytemora affinis]